MLRSYRIVIAAVAGLGASSPPGHAAESNQATTEQPRRTDIERIAAALEKLPQAQALDIGCDPAKEDRRSDLCAQWKAADAAKDSANWTERSFWLGVVGALIGSLTLAAFAAWWAKKAAEHTETGAKESKRSADISESVTRGWLSITIHEIGPVWRDSDGLVKVRSCCTIENCGTFPVVQASYGARVYSLFDNDYPKAKHVSDFLEELRTSGYATLALAPGQSITQIRADVVEADQLQLTERNGVSGFHFHIWIGATFFTQGRFGTSFTIANLTNLERDGFPIENCEWYASQVDFLQTGSNFS